MFIDEIKYFLLRMVFKKIFKKYLESAKVVILMKNCILRKID